MTHCSFGAFYSFLVCVFILGAACRCDPLSNAGPRLRYLVQHVRNVCVALAVFLFSQIHVLVSYPSHGHDPHEKQCANRSSLSLNNARASTGTAAAPFQKKGEIVQSPQDSVGRLNRRDALFQ